MTEFFDWLWTSIGGDTPKTLLLNQQFKQICKSMRKKTPKPLTDEEYDKTLKQMKTEAPAFLHYLRTTHLPDLPEHLKPFPTS